MKFDELQLSYSKNSLYRLNFYLFSFLILLLSPNYLMQFFPFFKYIWGIVSFIFIFLFFYFFKSIKININLLFLFLFYIILFIFSAFNFIRYDNQEGLYFSLGILAKFFLIYLFLMSFDIFEFIKIIKSLIVIFFFLCLHSLIGWLFFLIGLVQVSQIVEISTYYYNVMSIWGVYTVSIPLGWGEVIRNQSYFQEPGAFAFYVFVTMVLLTSLRQFFTKKQYNFMFVFLFLTMLTTFSATGIVLSILLSLFIFRSKILNIGFSVICIFILSYIIFSDNPYMNKIGSLEERLYGITNGIMVFDRDPISLLIGAGYNSERYLGFDGKFNNFLFEVVLYSGIFNLTVYMFFLISLHKLSRSVKFFYFLVLVFCATTPLFWSPMMLVLNLFMLRYLDIQRRVGGDYI